MRTLAIAAAACGFGAVSVVAKLAYDAGSSPRSLFAARVVLAGLFLSPFAIGSAAHPPGSRSLVTAGGAGIAFAAGGFLEFEALARLPASVLVTIVFLAPLWIVLASWSAGAPPGRSGMALLPVVLLGVAMLVGTPSGAPLDAVGVVLALGASVLFALVFLLLEQLLREEKSAVAIARVLVAAAAVAMALEFSGVSRELSHASTATYAVAIGALTAASFLLLGTGMARTAAFPAALITAVEPVAAAVASLVLLREALTPLQIVGGLAIVGSVVCVSRSVADAG
jgi:drug/metabolite transporter (DMT)-like permease